jgi:hypothetical protein
MAEEEIVKIKRLEIDGETAPLHAPLGINMDYELTKPVVGACWELIYEADMANKRQAVALHTSAPVDLAPGTHTFQHAAPEVKTEGIKEKYLLQVGLLKLTLHGTDNPNIVSVNMVTQVSKTGDGLIRSIMNPADE